jgi:hypothetical protein
MIERWIVEEFFDDYEDWFTWGQRGHDNRFHSYHNARKAYEDWMKDFHYSPCHYRYCKITIQPETIINKEVHSQGKDPAIKEDLTTDVESQTMKIT